MRAGYWIGLDRSRDRIVFDNKFLMMEEFMQKHNVCRTDLVGPFEDKNYCRRTHEAIVKCVLIYIHGSPNPVVVSEARNTSLFEPHGSSLGDIGGKLNYDLCAFYNLIDDSHLPKPPNINKKDECGDCGRDLPEPDNGTTFPGVTMKDNVLVCFDCYIKRREK